MTENTQLTYTPHETAILDLVRQLTESTSENYENIGQMREHIDALGDPRQEIQEMRREISNLQETEKLAQHLQASVDDMSKTINSVMSSDEKNTNKVIDLAESVSRSIKESRGQNAANKAQIDHIWKALNDEGRGSSANSKRLSKEVSILTKRIERLETQISKDSNSAKTLLKEMGRYMKLSTRLDMIERSLPKMVKKSEMDARDARLGADRIQNQLPAPETAE